LASGWMKGLPRMLTPEVGVQGMWSTWEAALCGGRSGSPAAVPEPQIEVFGAKMTHPTAGGEDGEGLVYLG
jgi:hypothetical protein